MLQRIATRHRAVIVSSVSITPNWNPQSVTNRLKWQEKKKSDRSVLNVVNRRFVQSSSSLIWSPPPPQMFSMGSFQSNWETFHLARQVVLVALLLQNITLVLWKTCQKVPANHPSVHAINIIRSLFLELKY